MPDKNYLRRLFNAYSYMLWIEYEDFMAALPEYIDHLEAYLRSVDYNDRVRYGLCLYVSSAWEGLDAYVLWRAMVKAGSKVATGWDSAWHASGRTEERLEMCKNLIAELKAAKQEHVDAV